MAAFFTRERFGHPQLYAGLLLLAFAAQCLYAMWPMPPRIDESREVHCGLRQWRHGMVEAGPESPLIPLIASAPAVPFADSDSDLSTSLVARLSRLPFMFIGLLRGASLWYIARRLYGNPGGYIALTLYCFSQPILFSHILVNRQGPAAWGFFGAIFSAIALSHTVYALGESPTEQLLGYRRWRWRRIVLLGVAIGIAIGSQHVTLLVVPLALAFMLYLAPGRRTAALGIVTAACGIALLVLLAAYFLRLDLLWYGMTQREWFPREQFSLGVPATWPAWQGRYGIPLLSLGAAALLTYLVWPRTRYFGNSAPLLVFIFLLAGSFVAPVPLAFEQHAIAFALVFIAGIMADLLETTHRKWVLAGLLLLLFGHAASMLAKVFWT